MGRAESDGRSRSEVTQSAGGRVVNQRPLERLPVDARDPDGHGLAGSRTATDEEREVDEVAGGQRADAFVEFNVIDAGEPSQGLNVFEVELVRHRFPSGVGRQRGEVTGRHASGGPTPARRRNVS